MDETLGRNAAHVRAYEDVARSGKAAGFTFLL